jgi:sulfoxide reductase heme-binding subunit YedZ
VVPVSDIPLLWFLARASGLTAYAFLTITVVLGIVAGAKTLPAWWPRFLTQGVHRWMSATALVLLCVHVAALVLDPFVTLDWVDAIVPFAADYKRFWSGLGTLAVDILVIVLITSLLRLRLRLGPRAWRAVHATAYAAWALALLHGLGTGTDTNSGAARAAYASSFGLVAASVLIRAARRPARVGVRLLDSQRESVR